jgi:hypothetical protein
MLRMFNAATRGRVFGSRPVVAALQNKKSPEAAGASGLAEFKLFAAALNPGCFQ